MFKIKRKKKRIIKYIPLEDIQEIDNAFLDEINRVKTRLVGVDNDDIHDTFYDVILNGYKSAIEFKAVEREVDYDIRFSEIEARANERRPFRRSWLWALLFQPLTNRAQDIIEARAELDADEVHTAAEQELYDDYKKLISKGGKALSKRELKKLIKKQLKAMIEEADQAEPGEVFEEIPDEVQKEELGPIAPAQGQLKGQMTIEEVAQEPAQAPTRARRPRPPRSCRKA